MRLQIISILLFFVLLVPVAHSDDDLYGTWGPSEYIVNGKLTPLRGIMIITPDYFVGNTIFDADGDGEPDANANSGPIVVVNGTIKLQQWMQLHWRSNGEGHFLKEDVPEDIKYTIEENRLIFHFPSGNKYISERLSGIDK
ncbi:MAG: hypothetical protein ACI909_000936 [Planctomycetota bacterium]|jgi:hypothetical protein